LIPKKSYFEYVSFWSISFFFSLRS
jgi:hypothetical protein